VPGFVVHKTGAQYRDEIARTLFTTDASWLDQLIRILRVVRTPKIGDRLDLRFLTQAFRTALPPLADDEVNQLADGWEQLERMRDERDTTEQALGAITEFTRSRWRPWADAVTRSAADPVIAATSALTQVTRDERTAKEALDQLSAQERTLNGQMTTLREERGRAVAEREQLQQQQAYRDAVAVAANAQQLAEAAHRAEALAARSAERARTAKAQIPNAARRLESARARATTADQEVERAAGHVAAHAEPAGLVEVTARFPTPT
jgi:chromosome segregation ATPase